MIEFVCTFQFSGWPSYSGRYYLISVLVGHDLTRGEATGPLAHPLAPLGLQLGCTSIDVAVVGWSMNWVLRGFGPVLYLGLVHELGSPWLLV